MGAGLPPMEEDDDSWLREAQALGTAFEKLFGNTLATKTSLGSKADVHCQAVLPSPATEAAAVADELAALRGDVVSGADAVVDELADLNVGGGGELVDAEQGGEPEEDFMDAESPPHEDRHEFEPEPADEAGLVDGPGRYVILIDTFATRSLAKGSKVLCELDAGQVVDVLEVRLVPCEHRVRANLRRPAPGVAGGWVSLLDTESGERFAAPEQASQADGDAAQAIAARVAELREQGKVLGPAAIRALAATEPANAERTLGVLASRDNVLNPSRFVLELLRRHASLKPLQGVPAPKLHPISSMMIRVPKSGFPVRRTAPESPRPAAGDVASEAPEEVPTLENPPEGEPPSKKARVAIVSPANQPQPRGRFRRPSSWQQEVRGCPGRPVLGSDPAKTKARSPAALRAASRALSRLRAARDAREAQAIALPPTRPHLQHAADSDSDSPAPSL